MDLNGRLESLKYLHENGCPWNDISCIAASEKGHLDCLRYLHENGCPWNGRCCYQAKRNGKFICLTYLLENGCPNDECSHKSCLNDILKSLHLN